MSFSVQHARTGLEYNGTSLNGLFAQRLNLLRPSFHRMIRDILRFNREAPALLAPDAADLSLGNYLEAGHYSREFVEHYIVPMGSAIWSATTRSMTSMPAHFFVRFFANHGMLTVNDRPVWRVVDGGSRRYLDRLVAGHRDRICLDTAVQWIRRMADHVLVKARGREPERFDRVFLACHSDQALSLLADPSPLERRVLGAIPYQVNEAVLHTDRSLMPRRRHAWAAWNYHVLDQPEAPVAVTYNMNILQGLDAPVEFLVTLNHSEAIDPAKIIQRIEYAHPVFTANAVAAQARHRSINGVNGTYYSGAYWRFGFHEDGVVSALAALTHFREDLARAERYFQRAG